MSGMELLLQAAGCSDASSCSTDCSATSSTVDDTHYGSSNVNVRSHCDSDSKTSLPPKKRMKLHFHNAGKNESSPLQLFRPVADAPSLTSCSGTSVASASSSISAGSHSSGSHSSSSSSLPLQLARGNNSSSSGSHKPSKKKSRASLVRDVDGNDMCMGYFSMPARQVSLSPSPSAEDQTQPTPQSPSERQVDEGRQRGVPAVIQSSPMKPSTSMMLAARSENNAALAAKSLLYQAYLAALNQTSSPQ